MKTFVYIAAPGGDGGPYEKPIKVGMSADVEKRIAHIQSCSPVGVHLAFSIEFPTRAEARAVENRFHREMRKYQLNGEWFLIEPWDGIRILGEIARGERL